MHPTTIVLLALLFAACSSSRDATRETTPDEATAALLRYEAGFRPSDYDARPAAEARPSRDTTSNRDSALVQLPTSMELVQGFRVQAMATSNIDEANAKKAELEGMFPAEWFYLEYDPPTYKIRCGNFLSRFEADRFARQLSDAGIRDAWTVPERVFKQPPHPPARRGPGDETR